MDNQPQNNFEVIQAANSEMLDYFNDAFLKQLEEIQTIKTQAFEIDIKIDELEKTKDIYAFKTNSRKSVFTPIISDGMDTERGKIIDEQIKDLSEAKISLNSKLRSLESSLGSLKKKLAALNAAEDAIKTLSDSYATIAVSIESTEASEDFEFIEEEKEDDTAPHGYNILMQDAFDKAFLTTLIDKNIKDSLTAINNKLETISYLLGTDISRARLTLREILHNSKQILDAVDDIEDRMDYNIDSAKPIWTQLDDYIMRWREKHPECIIETTVDCIDYEINLHPVFCINTVKLINIFFDNIFKHANANSIELKLCITPNIVDVSIHDNGIGIGSDYLAQSPWYSSLHKAHEIVYLLGGKLDINGDVNSGTQIRFSFPVQNSFRKY